MTSTNTLEDNIKMLEKYVEYFPDFPKPGILYKDILSLLSHSDGIKLLETILKQIANEMRGKVDCIAMLETRGFIFAPMLALHLNIPCIPVSKKGNLPGPVIEMSYILEYGEDILTVQSNSIIKGQKIFIVDDFLATGGTLEAATKLIQKAGGEVVQGLVLMEKLELEGRKRLNFPMISLMSE
ncbi:adenine phosphoribosyltransferase-like isoform X1 [Myzus persicae]|uniref:adenine phosphoribosyltransferase-like isoform X1 n=1 Tax=Myzus persicae TaxID=13164 RepID=UPI000B9352CD|nr:adenine phosphoribosyltransferase-like isoform X1 [Myzus persicae]XP_022180362.1 adenine phosphoribosyltransferase-like isoform X1 [Myzus persicae]XP_022180364.1 adenine phosphoribosyltransferase-like isoform X1 [Myzus persicae]